jgi:glycolate oxidase
MERDAIVFGYQFLKLTDKIPDDVQAQLLIEIDGNYPDILQQEAQQIGEVLEKFQVSDILFADTPSAQNEVFKVRRCLGEAVKGTTIYKEEDTVVPRAELPRLLNKVKEIGKIYGFQSVCYGHAGDGNLHVNIIKTPELSQEQWEILIPKAIREIFQFTLALKGTLSGEHGIGYVQQPYLDIAFSEVEINLFKNIKKLWDHKGILNPGKMGNALNF